MRDSSSLPCEWENAELNRPGTVNQPSAPYGIILPEPGIIRVSNMFIVLCFPLGCFMPCQPHGVVSDLDIEVFVYSDETFYMSLENFLSSMLAY